MATEQVSTTVPHIEELERIYRDHPSFIIRPLSASDLEAYHSLWKQPMLHLNQDDTDLHTDLSQTQDRLIRITKTLPSHGMHYAIFWKNSDGREGELMGEGGMKILEYSWPSLYYTFMLILEGGFVPLYVYCQVIGIVFPVKRKKFQYIPSLSLSIS